MRSIGGLKLRDNMRNQEIICGRGENFKKRGQNLPKGLENVEKLSG